MDAKERNLPFGQIHRKMISILRYLVERELTDQIRSGPVTDDTVGLQLYRSIIEEFGSARQYLSHQRNAIVRFHRFDFDIDVNITGPEQQLAGRCSDAADAGQHWLIEGIEYQRCDELAQTADNPLGLNNGLEQADAPLNQFSRRFERSVFAEPGNDSVEFLL